MIRVREVLTPTARRYRYCCEPLGHVSSRRSQLPGHTWSQGLGVYRERIQHSPRQLAKPRKSATKPVDGCCSLPDMAHLRLKPSDALSESLPHPVGLVPTGPKDTMRAILRARQGLWGGPVGSCVQQPGCCSEQAWRAGLCLGSVGIRLASPPRPSGVSEPQRVLLAAPREARI